MLELFEQPIKMMEKTTAFWQEMVNSAPWLKKPEGSLLDIWNSWIAGMRSANELNINAWKVLIENSEDAFFKMLKESRLYSQSLEGQLRESWGTLKKAQKSQQEAVEGLLEKVEDLLKKKEQAD